jgi:hypothetical protein
MSWMDKMKKAGKSVVDAGAKTMLKVRPVRPVILVFPSHESIWAGRYAADGKDSMQKNTHDQSFALEFRFE